MPMYLMYLIGANVFKDLPKTRKRADVAMSLTFRELGKTRRIVKQMCIVVGSCICIYGQIGKRYPLINQGSSFEEFITLLPSRALISDSFLVFSFHRKSAFRNINKVCE